MDSCIITLGIIAASAGTGALAFYGIVRGLDWARSKNQAQGNRLNDLEKRLEVQSYTLRELWRKAHIPSPPTPKEKKDAPVDTGAGILGVIQESPAAVAPTKDRVFPLYGYHPPHYEYTFLPKPYIEPTVGLYPEKDARTEIIVKPPIKRHRPNNKNYRGHGKGTNARLKLTEEQMLAMMEMSDKGMTGHQIADVFGVSRTTVQRVVAGTFQTGKQRGKA